MIDEAIINALKTYVEINPKKKTAHFTVRFDESDPNSPMFGQMEMYHAVANILTGIGGKYRGGKYKYQFDPTDAINAVIQTRDLNPFSLYETPDEVANLLVSLHPDLRMWCNRIGLNGEWLSEQEAGDSANLKKFITELPVILEPSAGRGALIRALKRAQYIGKIVAVEIDPINVEYLTREFGNDPNVVIIAGDILTVDLSTYHFDAAIMNPPFELPNGANPTLYIDHINYVLRLLRPRHKLAAISPVNWTFREDTKSLDFREHVAEQGYYEKLGKGTFKKSGTNIEILILHLRNDLACDAPGPWPAWADAEDQYPNYRCGTLANAIDAGGAQIHDETEKLFRNIAAEACLFDLLGFPMPKIKEMIQEYLQNVTKTLNKEQEIFIRLRPSDQIYMIDWIVDAYQTHCKEQERSHLYETAAAA